MDFDEAQVRVKKLTKTPEASELLRLYSLFKQGTAGDIQGKRPGLFDVRGRAKFDAWSAVRGMSQEDARQAYVDLVTDLEKKYGA